MKKTFSRVLSLVVALILILGLVACSKKTADPTETTEAPGKESNLTAPGELPIVREPITLTAFAELSIATDQDWNKHHFLEWVKEKTNITLEITDFGAEDPKTKRNTLLASNVYPDLFLTRYGAQFTTAEVARYGQKEKIFVNLSPLIKEHGFYLKKIMEERPDQFVASKADDGNMYAFPIIREEISNIVNPQAWVNTDWLEAVGLDRPKTVDDFINMLRAFKEQDPGEIGKDNILPYTSNKTCRPGTFIMLAFTEIDLTGNTAFRTGKGKLEYAPATDEFREALKVLNSMCAEGLFDPNSFTSDFNSGIAITSSGRVGVFENQHLLCMDWEDPETYRKFQLLTPLVGPKGEQNAGTVSDYFYNCNFFGALTDRCKHPEAALRFIDYWYSDEATLHKEYGKEGTVWVYNDDPKNVDVNGNKRLITYKNDGPRYKASHFGTSDMLFSAGPFNLNKDLYMSCLNGNLLDTCMTNNEEHGSEQVRYYLEGKANAPYRYEGVPADMFMELSRMEEILTIRPNLRAFFQQAYAEFVTGVRDPNSDADWEKYIGELKGLDMEKYVQYYGEAWTAWKKEVDRVKK